MATPHLNCAFLVLLNESPLFWDCRHGTIQAFLGLRFF